MTVLWLFFSIQFFFFDIDQYLKSIMPSDLEGFYSFRFLFLTLFLFSSWGLIPIKKSFPALVYLLSFPLIAFFWKIPLYLYKKSKGIGVLIYFNIVISIIQSLPRWSQFALGFLVGAIFIFRANNDTLHQIGIGLILTSLIIHYYVRIVQIFSPMKFLGITSNGVKKFLSSDLFKKIYALDASIFIEKQNIVTKITKTKRKPSPEILLSLKEKDDKILTNLQFSVLANRSLAYLSQSIKGFQETRSYLIFVGLSILSTLFFTITSFAIINYACYKISPLNYQYSGEPNFGSFLLYSILLQNTNLASIVPISTFSITLFVVQWIFSISFGLIVVGFFMSVIPEKYKSNFEKISQELDKQSKEVESEILLKHSMSLNHALSHLKQAGDGFSSVIIKFSLDVKDENIPHQFGQKFLLFLHHSHLTPVSKIQYFLHMRFSR